MKMNAIERTERREQIKATKAHLETVVEVFKATREETPAATVAELVNRLGYETAREAVAELVNTVGAWDGRIYEYVREWAQSVETAATRDELEAHSIYQPGDIHPAHINQIGQAMREYTPAEEIPAEEPANPTATARTDDGTFSGYASGCGYDKESAAVGEALNKSPAVMRVLYQAAEQAMKNGESFKTLSSGCVSWGDVLGYGSGYAILPYFEGGVGVSCFWSILQKCGFVCRCSGSGRWFDTYTAERKGA